MGPPSIEVGRGETWFSKVKLEKKAFCFLESK